MNPNLELQRLRQSLLAQGRSDDRVDELCAMAAEDINDAILEIVSDAVDEVRSLGLERGADELIENMTVQQVGDSFQISTQDGRLNFSEPPFPMLPKLLSGPKAKVSKRTGETYNVVPIDQDRKPTKRSLDLVDATQHKANALHHARNAVSDTTKFDAMAAARAYAEQMTGVKVKRDVAPPSGNIAFRTASSSQNAGQKWVRPAKELDMTGIVTDMNARIEMQITHRVQQIISSYGG